MKENPLIIGIETSCDETALAFIQNGKINGGVIVPPITGGIVKLFGKPF